MLRFLLALFLVATLFAPARSDAQELKLPGTWLNGPPVAAEQLQGKLVVLYFFEEDCPRCRGAWPEKLELAQKYADKPVVFIGVNSGTDPNELQRYLREVRCTWPTIVDLDRSFEKLAGVGEISLMNIYQLRVITPEGKLEGGDWSNWDGTIERHLGRAKWRVDPTEIPPALKPAWQLLELGDFGGALAGLSKSKKAKDEKSVAAVSKLTEAIEAEAQARLTAAQSAQEAGKNWEAYRGFQAIAATFKGLPVATEAKDAEKKLAGDAAVAKEIKAAAQLKKATAKPAASPAAVKRRAAALQAIIKDYAETEAAAEAQRLLNGT